MVILALAPDEAPRSSAKTGPLASATTRTGTEIALKACDVSCWTKEAFCDGFVPKASVKATHMHRSRMAEVCSFIVTERCEVVV